VAWNAQSQELGKTISPDRGWCLLRDLGAELPKDYKQALGRSPPRACDDTAAVSRTRNQPRVEQTEFFPIYGRSGSVAAYLTTVNCGE